MLVCWKQCRRAVSHTNGHTTNRIPPPQYASLTVNVFRLKIDEKWIKTRPTVDGWVCVCALFFNAFKTNGLFSVSFALFRCSYLSFNRCSLSGSTLISIHLRLILVRHCRTCFPLKFIVSFYINFLNGLQWNGIPSSFKLVKVSEFLFFVVFPKNFHIWKYVTYHFIFDRFIRISVQFKYTAPIHDIVWKTAAQRTTRTHFRSNNFFGSHFGSTSFREFWKCFVNKRLEQVTCYIPLNRLKEDAKRWYAKNVAEG